MMYDLKTIHAGQHHIQHDHIVIAGRSIGKPVPAIVNNICLISGFLHNLPQCIRQSLFILYN